MRVPRAHIVELAALTDSLANFAGDAQATGDERHRNRDGKPHLVDGVIRTKDGAGDFEDDSAGG
jgi:hypothetical protein